MDHDPTRRSTYQNLQTRFQGTQVEALKDIHLIVEKGKYVAIINASGNPPSNILASWTNWRKDGSTLTASTLDHQEQGCVQFVGKTSLSSRLQPCHLVGQGQYPQPLGPLSRDPLMKKDN